MGGRGRISVPALTASPALPAFYLATIVVAIVLVPVLVPVLGLATAFPASRVVPATGIVRICAVSAPIRRTRPVTIAPDVLSVDWIPVTLDPVIARSRRCRNGVRPRCRWFTDANAEADLRSGERGRSKK